MESVTTNWGDLPPELLHLIVKKLPDICDFIGLRAVCKKWRTSISISDLQPQFPWILMRNNGSHCTLQFYSITSEKMYKLRLPKSSSKKPFQPASMFAHMYGFRDQFSLFSCERPRQFGKRFFSLLNPLNNSEVRLPFSDGPQFSTTWISPRTVEVEDFILLSNGTRQLALCKPSNGNWDGIGRDSGYKYVYLKGFFFTIDESDHFTIVIDISSQRVVHAIPPPKLDITEEVSLKGPLLVESFGEILSVYYTHYYELASYKFYLHQLEFSNENKRPCWVKITSIHDRILFFDFIHHHGFSLRADHGFPGLQGNCIFFIEQRGYLQFNAHSVIIRHDIENGENQLINCPFKYKRFMWFMPSLNYI